MKVTNWFSILGWMLLGFTWGFVATTALRNRSKRPTTTARKCVCGHPINEHAFGYSLCFASDCECAGFFGADSTDDELTELRRMAGLEKKP